MNKIYSIFYTVLIIVVAQVLMGRSAGPTSVLNSGYAGAPGDGICSNCHGGTAFGVLTTDILITPVGGGAAVTEYIPSTTYDITVTLTAASGSPAGYGFQLVAVDGAGAQAGTLSNGSSNVKFSPANNGRTYAEHNARSVSNVFTMQWTAPANLVAAGPIEFYATGIAANGGGTGGDSSNGTPTTITLQEATLPLQFVDFTAEKLDRTVKLNWEVENIADIDYFVLERSFDGITFQALDYKSAEEGFLNYNVTDRTPVNGTNYYRVKHVEYNGQYDYSEVVSIKITRDAGEILIYPNPALATTTITFSPSTSGDFSYLVYDGLGRMIQREAVQVDIKGLSKELDTTAWPKGVYLVVLNGKNERITQRLLKL